MVQIHRPKKKYEEHRREFTAAKGLHTNLDELAVKLSPSLDQPARVPAGASSQFEKPARIATADKTLRLKFTVQAPKAEIFDYFDRAVAVMGDGKALRLIIARAFDQLEAAIEAGEEVPRETYPIDGSRRANTSRHVSAELYASAKRALDPMDLQSPGSFGRELAMAALARYLKLPS